MAEHAFVLGATVLKLQKSVEAAARLMAKTLRGEGCIFFCGNGGSACDAMHLATECVVRFKDSRPAYAAVALSADSALLTASGNDLGFEQVFARQVEALGRPRDLLIALSTSGTSPNVLAALREAKAQGLKSIALSGAAPITATVNLAVPSTVTARIQEMHIFIGHCLIERLEELMTS